MWKDKYISVHVQSSGSFHFPLFSLFFFFLSCEATSVYNEVILSAAVNQPNSEDLNRAALINIS